MKKKINLNLALVSLLTIFATVVVSISMFYQLFKSEIGDNLRDIAYAISDKDVINEMKSGQYKPLMDDIRITLIDSNGKVLYDSEVDPAVLDNHLARPEVESAIKNGSGKSVRRSDTIMKNVFYYAMRLDTSDVLRVSRESGSMWNMFGTIIPFLLLMIGVIYVVCNAVGYYLVRQIIEPIENLSKNMDAVSEAGVYSELQPFVETIKNSMKTL